MLQIQKIYKKYVTGDLEQTALDGVSLNLRDNEFVAILGPSGSGKTTLLNVIGGLDRYDSGDLIINGISTKKYKDRDWDSYRNHTIGFVFQSYNLIPHQTVLSNVELALTISGISKSERKRRATEALEKVGLGKQLHKKPNQMSGGQMQRVAIARALVKEPKVLLLDEPLSNLDARLRLQTREEIRRIQRETGITTIFVTHEQEEAMSISDEIVVMKFGVEQQTDAPQKVYDNPKNLFVAKFLGTPPINVFSGYVHDGGLYIGEDRIGDTELENQEVTIGIRPEGFEICEEGTLSVHVKQIEHIGRDMSVIGTNPLSEKDTFRFIIESGIELEENTDIKVAVKPHKCFVFHKVTEERLQ